MSLYNSLMILLHARYVGSGESCVGLDERWAGSGEGPSVLHIYRQLALLLVAHLGATQDTTMFEAISHDGRSRTHPPFDSAVGLGG